MKIKGFTESKFYIRGIAKGIQIQYQCYSPHHDLKYEKKHYKCFIEWKILTQLFQLKRAVREMIFFFFFNCMKAGDNVILEPFGYNIEYKLNLPLNHENSVIQSLSNSQSSCNLPNLNDSMIRMEKEQYLQVCFDKKSYQNELLKHKKSDMISQKKGKQGSNANDLYEKNHKWFQYLQNQQLQEQQVDMKERQKEIEKSIQRYDCEYRMLCCYYYFKYLIPATVILVPFLLYIYRY